MQLSASRCADVVLLRPVGRIDHNNAESFAKSLGPHVVDCRSDGDALLFDLSGLEYISSAGLRVLMLVSKNVMPQGGRVMLATSNLTQDDKRRLPLNEVRAGDFICLTVSDSGPSLPPRGCGRRPRSTPHRPASGRPAEASPVDRWLA